MIGETLYIYDRYSRNEVRPVTITGETRMSWMSARGDKIDKKTMCMRGDSTYRVLTLAQLKDEEWARSHRREIVILIERADAATLRKYAVLLGVE